MSSIRKAVILAAGMGTRMIPATKAIPKEMLPIVDRPLIQYSVEEAVAAGIEHIIFVIAEGKESVREHFGHDGRVEAHARGKGDDAMLATLRFPADLAHFDYVYQDRPAGPAHAVACAREFLEGDAFALFYPDDLILGGVPCIGELADAFDAAGGSVIAVQQVPDAEVPQYGIVDPSGDGDPIPLRGLVEKPSLAEAPSRLGIVGRYILSASIFAHIDRAPAGKGGEKFVTEALVSQIEGGEPVFAATFSGARYDTGRPLGMLVANAAAALRRDDLAPAYREQLTALLGRAQA